MKLTTNFAPALGRAAAPAAIGLWIVAAGLFVGSAALWAHRAQMVSELPDLAAQEQRLMARRGTLEAVDLPEPAALAELRRQVARINALLQPPPPDLASALSALETVLPRPVRLVSLRVEADGRALVLLAEAPPDANLPALLQALGRSEAFSDVRLVQQQEVGSRDRRTVRAEIRVSGRQG